MKTSSKAKLNERMAYYSKCEMLRRDLIDGRRPAAADMTGQSMHNILQELKQGMSIRSPLISYQQGLKVAVKHFLE